MAAQTAAECGLADAAASLSAFAGAQDPLSADAKFWYSNIKGYVLRAAEKMPEANYSFKPAPEVRAPFSLIFTGPPQPIFQQGTYRLEHPELPVLELFVVPVTPGADGARYQVIFN